MTGDVDDVRIPARVGRLTARWSHLTAARRARQRVTGTEGQHDEDTSGDDRKGGPRGDEGGRGNQ